MVLNKTNINKNMSEVLECLTPKYYQKKKGKEKTMVKGLEHSWMHEYYFMLESTEREEFSLFLFA